MFLGRLSVCASVHACICPCIRACVVEKVHLARCPTNRLTEFHQILFIGVFETKDEVIRF